MAQEMNIRPRHSRRGMPVVKPKNMKQTLSRLWQYLRAYKLEIILVFFAVCFTTLANLAATRLIGVAIDKYIAVGDMNGLFGLLIKLMIMYVLTCFFTLMQLRICIHMAQETVTKIRKDLFDKLQSIPLKYFDTHPHGEIMSRISNDVDNIGTCLNTGISQIFSSLITVVGMVILMITISPILTLITLIMIPILLLSTSLITKKSRVYFKQQQAALGELNGKVEEVISGQKAVKVFVKEEAEIESFTDYNENLREAGINAQIFSGVIGPMSTFINNLTFGFSAAIGGVLVIFGMLKLGSITSFLLFSRQLGRPFNEIAQQYNMILSAIAGAERVFEVIDEDTEPEDSENAVELKDIKGDVVFKDVEFSYDGEKVILTDFNLEVKSGQTVAFVGPTGAGKTTVVNLLTRFYDIQKGQIFIDGNEIKSIKRSSLRSALGVVLQDTYLFSGTIMENIRYGNLSASDNDVKTAAILANAHDFIKKMPQEYDTVLTEDADSLSQGQKQMLAIARAILADSPILILDEATSNVDTRTEVKIQSAMLNLMKGRTSFIIAHRLSTIRNADIIAVINDGRIVERGNHKELIAKKGFYYELYMNQFK